jgi:hypothetical protein
MQKVLRAGAAAAMLLAVTAVAWAATNNHNSSKSNPYPPVIIMPGSGDDFQLSSKANVSIKTDVPGAMPRDARARFEKYVDALLAQIKGDLMQDFERKHKLTGHVAVDPKK